MVHCVINADNLLRKTLYLNVPKHCLADICACLMHTVDGSSWLTKVTSTGWKFEPANPVWLLFRILSIMMLQLHMQTVEIHIRHWICSSARVVWAGWCPPCIELVMQLNSWETVHMYCTTISWWEKKRRRVFCLFVQTFFEEFLFSMIYVTVKFSSVSDHEN